MQALILAALRAAPSAAIKALLPLIERLITTGAAERVFWWAAETLVKRTDTPQDDQWLAKIKELSGKGPRP